MPAGLRYFLFLLLGISLGLIYLWISHTPAERINLETGSLWVEQIPTPTPTPLPALKLLFGGDLMFDRNVRTLAEEIGYDGLVEESLKELFLAHDLVIANLEGPLTERTSLSAGTGPGDLNNTRFTFDPTVANWLAKHNFQMVNLGNNHSLDFGVEGAESTQRYLDQAGVAYFGWIGEAAAAQPYNRISTTVELNDLALGLINYNQFGQQAISSVLQEIASLKDQVDYLIVYTHWGIEYAPTANAVITAQGRQFIEAGAHLVIGTHPHVIQPYEDYLHGRIYYSLGNFIFDQYFSPEVQKGQLVQLELEKLNAEATPSASFKEFEVFMQPRQAVRLESEVDSTTE